METEDRFAGLPATLPDVLRHQATLRPRVPFVVTDEVSWTYAEVDAMADHVAAGLHALGVGHGDAVALMVDNCAELVPLVLGVNRLGAVWTPTNTDYKGDWLCQTLQDGGARVLVVDEELHPRVEAIQADLTLEHVIVRTADGTGLLDHPGPFPEPPHLTSETAAVLWTSGTTGRAKGVMQPHRAWMRASVSGARSARTVDDDVIYCCLPLYNSAGWIGAVFRALHAGVTVAIDREFSVSNFWDRVRHFGATQTFTLGAMHMYLWQQPERPDDGDNPVRCFGATPMPDALIEPFRRRFGVEIIQQGYGQSEVMGLLSRTDDGTRTWGPNSVGEPLGGIEVKLLDDEDQEVGVDEVGEFCVRPTEPFVLFNGYLGQPEATLAAYRNLWYHTGDLGRRDAQGDYSFVDRKRDYIRHKGRSVSSFAIEAVLRDHPAVAEVAAFGVPSGVLESEHEVMVAVVPMPGATADPAELARHVNDHAPYFFVPRYIDIVDSLPHTPTGKVQKFDLRARSVTATTWDRETSGFEVQR
jgi:crotonobetaine/carnitine-CoA ligase